MRKTLPYVLIIVLRSTLSLAQIPNVDSLNSATDSVQFYSKLEKLKLQWKILSNEKLSDVSDEISYSFGQLNDPDREYYSYLFFGDYLKSRGLMANALVLLNEARGQAGRITDPEKGALFTFALAGRFQDLLPSAALSIYEESEQLYKKLNQPHLVGRVLNLYSIFLFTNGDYLGSSTKAMAGDSIFRSIQNAGTETKRDWMNCLNTVGLALTKLGKHEEALLNFDKALDLADELNDPLWKGLIIGNAGTNYYHLGNKRTAEECVRTDIYYSKKFNNKKSAADAALTLAGYYFENKDITNSRKYLDSAITWNEGTRNRILSKSHLFLATWYLNNRQFEKAYQYSTEGHVLDDSLNSAIKLADVLQSKSMFELSRKQQELDLLKANQALQQKDARIRNLVILISISGLVVMSIVALLFYRNVRQKRVHLKTLHDMNQEIASQNDELIELNHELNHQGNVLAEQNKLIEAQKVQLVKSNETLEHTVGVRTEELTKQNIQLEQFSYMTSHNLRSPVARLLGLTQLFNKNNLADPFNEQLIDRIRTSAQEFDVTMQDIALILEVRKGLNGNFTMVKLEDCLLKARTTLGEESIAQQLLISEFKEPTVFGIEPYVTSIFYNLISNSIKFKKEINDMVIKISSREERGKVVLEYKDNGMGFNQQEAGENLFQPFKRFHLHREGRGLGLYMIKIQTEAMGGAIKIESAPNKGFSCVIFLPKK